MELVKKYHGRPLQFTMGSYGGVIANFYGGLDSAVIDWVLVYVEHFTQEDRKIAPGLDLDVSVYEIKGPISDAQLGLLINQPNRSEMHEFLEVLSDPRTYGQTDAQRALKSQVRRLDTLPKSG